MYAYFQDMPGVSEEVATRVEAQIGQEPVPGLVAHVAGPTPVGWRIIDVWDTEESYVRFQRERLNPAVEVTTQGLTPPERPFEFQSVTGVGRLAHRS
jgi:hypothetical protein